MELYKRPAKIEIINANSTKASTEYLNEPSFKAELIADPELVRLFDKHGITRRGRYTWSLTDNGAINRNKFKDFFIEYSKKFTPYTLHSGRSELTMSNMFNQRWLTSVYSHPQLLTFNNAYVTSLYMGHTVNQNVSTFFNSRIITDLDNDIINMRIDPIYKDALTKSNYNTHNRQVQIMHSDILRDNFSPFVITMEMSNNTLYFRLRFVETGAEIFREDIISQDSFSDKISGMPYMTKTVGSKMLNISEIMQFINVGKKVFGKNLFTKNSQEFIKVLDSQTKNTLFIQSVPGKPSIVNVMNPHDKEHRIQVPRLTKTGKISKSRQIMNTVVINAYGKATMSLAEALNAKDKSKVVIHDSLIDLKNMNESQPYDGDERLYGYQRRAVGLQLSTKKGFLNALDTGIGKSIVQLTSMRERAKTIDNYRGIIVCQSNTKKQWEEYAIHDKWFPEAEIIIVDSGKSVDKLIEGLSQTGPVVVIATFNMVATVASILENRKETQETVDNLSEEDAKIFLQYHRDSQAEKPATLADVLVDAYWDDICADEATSIRNGTSSDQAVALWHMRQNSEIGTALTATPFNKSIDDIARLLEWVRNEKHMFYGNKLSNLYDQENITAENAKEIFDTLYPMVFRFTKEEAQAEEKEKIKIPEELKPETLLLQPSPAELALSNACEYELKRIVGELETALINYEAKTEAEKAEVDAAREELKEAHGHWMAGTNVARMATSDPSSILTSKSMAAQLLVGQGLVDNAMQNVPTKQKILLQRIPKHVSEGQQILIFTDFVPVADNLKDALEEIGVRTGVFAGKNLKQRDQNRIEFQKGNLDVLICTKAAERGLTLHKASVVYHYDMSWTLEPLLQKTGRAARVGSENKTVETYFLILQNTIEEKVVDKVFTQGTLSSMVLDSSRGIDIKNTTTGKLMGGLMNASSNINSRRGALEFGKQLLGV